MVVAGESLWWWWVSYCGSGWRVVVVVVAGDFQHKFHFTHNQFCTG